ncbi:transketolase C-terminal domain-containing protein [uncultured Cohaesibacter sp.]|uniref:transketolase family protein n=1 Tax=uncultured Cohaesibacter sp. TaxID=1002546 RepID=UPI0029C8832B|nr:transketolase C-terminal domain-containing protein [uncultured Cohaesibacter sp.]
MNAVSDVKQDMREAMIASFLGAVERDVDLMTVVSDSTSTSKIGPFKDKYPDRVINVGIAEQTLVGVAAGLALGGHVAVTANAAPFLIARSNEQVKNDVCYSNTNVKLVGLYAGVGYGPLGATHHAIDDISIMRGLGNIQIFAPSDAIEAGQVFDYAIGYDGPVYIRLDSAALPHVHAADYHFEPGRPDVLRRGDDCVIVALGSVVHEAVDAAKALAEDGVSVGVVSLPSIRPLDTDAYADILKDYRHVVTVEEHSVHGALGSLTAEIIVERQLGLKLKRLGFPEGQFSKAGPRADIRRYYKIDANGIIETIRAVG